MSYTTAMLGWQYANALCDALEDPEEDKDKTEKVKALGQEFALMPKLNL